MKTKNFSKKLELKKDTISKLNTDELKAVYGGHSNQMTNCAFCSKLPSLCLAC